MSYTSATIWNGETEKFSYRVKFEGPTADPRASDYTFRHISMLFRVIKQELYRREKINLIRLRNFEVFFFFLI